MNAAKTPKSAAGTPTRRQALGGVLGAAAAPLFVPARAFGANSRVTTGHIGVGKMGGGHVRRLAGEKRVQIAAICDVDTMSREQALGFAKARYGADHKGIALYNEYEQLLARDDIDAVVIATPDHWHAIIATRAAQAGKDIYCEKPLTLTIGEARDLIDTARRYDTVFQTGSQQRSSGNFRHACELVRNGYLGALKTIHIGIGGTSKWCDLPSEPTPPGLDWDRWLGPAPTRGYHPILRPPHNNSFPNWRHYREYSGGMMTDWGAHHFDIAQWALGKDDSGPSEVHPPGAKTEHLTYIYDNGVQMYHHMPADAPSGNGVLFTGTEGKLFVNRGMIRSWPEQITRIQLKPSDTRLYDSPGHHTDWLNCIASRRRPICDVSVGAHTVTTCHVGNICYWTGLSLKWDPAQWRFDHPVANNMIDRARREPYTS